MLRPGMVVDRYEVEVEIGRGGSAVVYRVRHRTLGSAHALKLLVLPGKSVCERVLQEGRMQASLRHPNIVTVTDAIEVEGSPALIMDYVDGVSLEQWLGREARDPGLVMPLFREIVSGVAAAHERGMIHRDLKPANVLMSRQGGRWVPMITDFGLAKALMSAVDGATRSGVALGTPSYMAPEQIRNARVADQRADVFSLGAILYRMLTGVEPFQGEDVLAILMATAEGEFIPPELRRPDLPERLTRVITACLAPDPRQRLQSCGRLIEALDGGVPLDELWKPGLLTPGNETIAPMSLDLSGPLDVSDASSPSLVPLQPGDAPPVSWSGAGGTRGVAWTVIGLLLLAVVAAALTSTMLSRLMAIELGSPRASADDGVEVTVPLAAVAPAPEATAEVAEPPAELSPPAIVSTPRQASSPGRSAAPVAPERAPRASAPTPAAAVSAGGTALVSSGGGAEEIWLEADGKRLRLGQETPIPAGTYAIQARFSGGGAVLAGRATVQAGSPQIVRCSEAFQQCRMKSAQ